MEDIDNGTTDNTNNGTNNGTTGNETTPKSLPTGDSPNKSLPTGEDSNKSLEEGEDPHKTLPTRDHETKKINESEHETKANDEAYEEPKEEVKADLFNLDYFDKPEEASPEVTEKASELINGDLNYFDNWITEAEDQKKQNKEQLEEYLKSNVESGNQLAYTQEDLTEAQRNLQSAKDSLTTTLDAGGLFGGVAVPEVVINALRPYLPESLRNATDAIYNESGPVLDRNPIDTAANTAMIRDIRSNAYGNTTSKEEALQKIREQHPVLANNITDNLLNEWAENIVANNKQKQIQEDLSRNGPTVNSGISKAQELDLMNRAASDYSSLSDSEKEMVGKVADAVAANPNVLNQPLNPLEPSNSRNNRAIAERNQRLRENVSAVNEAREAEARAERARETPAPETPTRTEAPTVPTRTESVPETSVRTEETPSEPETPSTSTTPDEPARTEETPATSTSATSSTTDDLRSAHEETTLAAMDLAEALGTSPSNIEDSDTARALQSGEFGNITSADEMRRALIEDAGFPLDESTNAWARWAAARNRERITRESGTPRGTERGETPTEETSTTESETPETETESSETSEEEGTTDVEPETETPTTSSDEDVIAKADEAKAAYEEAKKREYEAIHREADETEIAQLAAEVERLRQEWEEAEAEAAALRPREDGEDSTKEPRVGHGKEDRELSKEETLPEWIGGDDPHTSSAGAYWAGAFGDENWSDKVPQKTAQGLIDYANDHHDNPFAMFGMTALMEAGGYDALKAGRDVQDMIASAKEVTVNANNALEFFKNGSVLDGIKSILSTGWSVLKVLGNTLSAAWNVCKSAFSFLRSVFAPISSAVSSFLNTVKGYNSVKAMIRDMYGIENTDEVIKEVFGDESEKNAEQKPVNALNKTGFSVKGGTITDESGYNKGMKEKENDIASDVCKKTMLYFPYLRKSFR